MKASTVDATWRTPTIPEPEHMVRIDGTTDMFRNVSQPIKVFVFFIFIPLWFSAASHLLYS